MTTLMTITPRATEKAYAQSQNNVYVFNVPLASNKKQIVAAVESQYDVKVVNIKTLVQSGKAIRFNRGKGKYPGSTTRSDSKKAYITLAEGDSIQVFAEPETKSAKEEKK